MLESRWRDAGLVAGILAILLAVPVAAQTSFDTPWSSKATSLNPPAGAIELAVDSAGEILFEAFSSPLPVTKQVGDLSAGSVLIGKTSANGQEAFLVQLGGAETHFLTKLVPDAAGNVYVLGYAAASGLPATSGAYQNASTGDVTPFVCKLNGTDGSPMFCTYVGSNLMYWIDMAIDVAGNAYVLLGRKPTSATAELNATPHLATTGPLSIGDRGVVVMKISATGSKLIFAAEFGGSGSEMPYSIALDSASNVYVLDITTSADFPGALNTHPEPIYLTGVVAKLDALGTHIDYAIYAGAKEGFMAMAVDASGEVHVIVQPLGTPVISSAPGYPILPTPYPQARLRKYATTGSSVIFEAPVFLDGTEPDDGSLVQAAVPVLILDDQGVSSVINLISSPNYPVHNATETCSLSRGFLNPTTGTNLYLSRFDPSGAVLQATYLATGGLTMPIAVNIRSTGGYVITTDPPGDTLGVIQLSAGGAVTAFGCYGNGGSFQIGPLAPGQIISIFGEGLGPDAGVTNGGPNHSAPGSLGGTQVTFDGVPAPLLYAQSSQINAVAPWGISGQKTTKLCASYNSNNNCTSVPVAVAAPGFFQYTASNIAWAAAINQDGTFNSLVNPAPHGSIVSLYMTGLGAVSPTPADGDLIGFPLPVLTSQVQVAFLYGSGCGFGGVCVFGVPAQVTYAGPAPFEIGGVYQVNVKIPDQGAYPPLSQFTLAVQGADGSTYSTTSLIAVEP